MELIASERSQEGWGTHTLSQGEIQTEAELPQPYLSRQAPDLGPVSLGTPSLPTSSLFSGKFGAVCTCTEKATGLKLAAKVIKKQTPKDKVVGAGYLGGRGGVLAVGSRCLSPPSTHMSALGAWCVDLAVLKIPLR